MTTTTALPLAPGRWALDPFHSSVGFTIRHLGVSKVRGRFATFDASMVVGDDLDTTIIEAVIDLSSIDTGNSDRDAHVRAADMLDVANRPTMTFRSTTIEGSASQYVLTGDLTIGGMTKPISFDVEFGGLQEFPGGPRHAGFEARGEFRRSEFGLDLNLPPGVGSVMLSDVVKVELDIQLLEP